MTFFWIGLSEKHGGPTEVNNLAYACSYCNKFKGNHIEAEDPLTGEVVPLFNPRQQKWADHFRWSREGTQILGLSANETWLVMAAVRGSA